MASWRRNKHGHVLVDSYWHKGERLKKRKQIPRSKTKQLDAEPDHNIEVWVKDWERDNEKRHHADKIQWSDSTLEKYLAQFKDYLLSRGRDPSTVDQHLYLLRTFAIHYFLDQGLKDPNQWPGASIRLLPWLEERSPGKATTKRVNISLRLFYNWLTEEGIIQTGVKLRLRNPVIPQNKTPLKVSVSPDDVLEWARTCKRPDYRLIGLCGYFFSLRPNEVFGLRKSDFRAGSGVEILDVAKAMKGAGLFSKFAVKVQRQRSNAGEIKAPKSHSEGWVACFNEQAARMIIDILKDIKDLDEPLIKFSNNSAYRHWGRIGIENVTVKDLRRSSLLWLGHNTALGENPFLLQRHARHRRLETTTLYTRTPDQDLEDFKGDLDLSA